MSDIFPADGFCEDCGATGRLGMIKVPGTTTFGPPSRHTPPEDGMFVGKCMECAKEFAISVSGGGRA